MFSKDVIHVMLDLETMGVIPGCPIIQIGAVAHNFSTNYIDTHSCNISLQTSLLRGFKLEADTLYWWLQQDQEAIEKLFELPLIHIEKAVQDFYDWYRRLSDEGKVETYLWSHGASFDVPILAYAFNVIGMEIPWDHRNIRDTRTLFAIAEQYGYEKGEYVGTAHNALDDAMNQMQMVQKALQLVATTF